VIKAGRQVELHYRNRRNRRLNQRRVHPYGFLHGHRNDLLAWHAHPRANRMALFSLPNIEKVETLADAFARDPAFSLDEFAARSFGVFQEEPFAVAWRFHRDAARDAADFRFHPDQQLDWQPDGSLVVRFTAGSDLEMAWRLYAWGDKVEVLEPARLANMAHGQLVAWPALP